MISRLPPQNLEAERAVLGACIIDNTVIPEVEAVLDPADFYFPSHHKIFDAILILSQQGQPVDLITVSDFLKGTISAADIAAMVENALPSHVEAHARAVKETAHKRKLTEAMRQADEDLCFSADDCLAIAGRLSSTLSHLQNGGPKGFAHVSQVMTAAFKQIELAQEGSITGIPTGLTDLDRRIGGIQPGETWIIAGRPSMGKTALAVTIARGSAQRDGVAFVTVESPAPKIGQRLLSEMSGIENRDLRRGRISTDQVKELVEKAAVIGNLPMWFLDSERSWDRIKANLRALKLREPRVALALVDYIGLLSAPVPRGERYLELGRISSEAKGLAMELEIGVVLLSQLNREVEGREDKRPRLSDLRESGCLEQDADVVALLYRDSYYNERAWPRQLSELNIAKNRDGATGVIKLRFNEETVSFSDWVEPLSRNEFTGADA